VKKVRPPRKFPDWPDPSVEQMVHTHRAYVLDHAARSGHLSDFENWFYSVFWEELNSSELERVHAVLSSDDGILMALGKAEPVVIEE
jgi:hypothetical protein